MKHVFKRKSQGSDTITKTDRGESYSKPVESTRSSKWTAGHLHSEPTSWQHGDISTPVRFHIHSPSFSLRAEKSTLPARTVLCSLLPCGSPLPYLSSLLSLSVIHYQSQVLAMWGSGRYSSELQSDDHLNSASSTLWAWRKVVVTEHVLFPVCLLLLPPAFSFHMWQCNIYAFVESWRLFTFEIFLTNCIRILFNLKSVTLNVWSTEDLIAELLWGVVRSPADYLNKPSLNPKIFTIQWQAHAWFESVTQSQPRCQTNNFQ